MVYKNLVIFKDVKEVAAMQLTDNQVKLSL